MLVVTAQRRAAPLRRHRSLGAGGPNACRHALRIPRLRSRSHGTNLGARQPGPQRRRGRGRGPIAAGAASALEGLRDEDPTSRATTTAAAGATTSCGLALQRVKTEGHGVGVVPWRQPRILMSSAPQS